MTITEFLLACIEADESVARAASRGIQKWSQPLGVVDAAHIIRHDPARVLAECEAKRRIVELHSCFLVGAPPYDPACSDPPARMVNLSECITLKALAAVYADHPDYDQAWSL